jgi:dGTPase
MLAMSVRCYPIVILFVIMIGAFWPGSALRMMSYTARGSRVKIDEELEKEVAILKELTWTYVIEAPALATQREGQKRIIRLLFEAYTDASESRKRLSLFPPYYRYQVERSKSAAQRKRIVVDPIAGMTEPQAIASYAQLMGVQPTVTLEEIVR